MSGSTAILLIVIAVGLTVVGCRSLQPDTVASGTEGDDADAQCREDFFCWSQKHMLE